MLDASPRPRMARDNGHAQANGGHEVKAKHFYRYWVVGHISSYYAEARGLKDLLKRAKRKRGSRAGEIHRIDDLGRSEEEATK